jgi:hypothetical protein
VTPTSGQHSCPKCGTQLQTTSRFCWKCGGATGVFPIPEVPSTSSPVPGGAPAEKCPSCGSDVPPGKKFCRRCGAGLTSQSPARLDGLETSSSLQDSPTAPATSSPAVNTRRNVAVAVSVALAFLLLVAASAAYLYRQRSLKRELATPISTAAEDKVPDDRPVPVPTEKAASAPNNPETSNPPAATLSLPGQVADSQVAAQREEALRQKRERSATETLRREQEQRIAQERDLQRQREQDALRQQELEAQRKALEDLKAKQEAQQRQIEEARQRLAEEQAQREREEKARREAARVQILRPDPVAQSKPVQPAYSGPSSGEIVWEGIIRGTELVTIENGQASSGMVTGSLPGVACLIQPTDAKKVSIASAPGPRNQYNRLVIRVSGNGRTRVTLKWSLP